jgi:hypothetical protein
MLILKFSENVQNIQNVQNLRNVQNVQKLCSFLYQHQ